MQAGNRVWAIKAGLVLVLALAQGAQGQSAWPGYPNNAAISVTSGGNVGIGTTTAGAKLHVSAGADVDGIRVSGAGSGFAFVSGNHNGGNSSYSRLGYWTGSGFGNVVLEGNVGIGTTSPQYKLAVNGTIGAKDIIVTSTGWSDYVFRPDYRLRSLGEVSAFIEEHRHLPDIPSEAEVKEKGVSVAEMQAKLLAKIEELTLHMIQQEKENRELRERLVRLESRSASSTTGGTER